MGLSNVTDLKYLRKRALSIDMIDERDFMLKHSFTAFFFATQLKKNADEDAHAVPQ